MRGNVLSLREQDYVVAARAIGAGRRVILRHVLPNTFAPVIVAATLGVGNASSSKRPPASSAWASGRPRQAGGACCTAPRRPRFAPWVAIFPGPLILVTVLCINFVGDGLRDALDPRLRVE